MIFNMVGGGASLNFEVVGGTTQPTSPKEVTVWVNTDAQITGWAFSPDEPTNLVDGMVWFNTGTSGTISFDALKKNEINVRPNGAFQYISSEWVKKEMLVYQSGEWVSGAAYLYENGRFYNGASLTLISTGSVPSLSYGSTAITVTATSGQTGHFHFKDKVDLTGFSTLKMSGFSNNAVETDGGSETWKASLGLNVRSIPNGSTAAEAWKWDMPSQKEVEITLDISALKGEYYVFLYFGRSSTSNGNLSYDVQEVQLLG